MAEIPEGWTEEPVEAPAEGWTEEPVVEEQQPAAPAVVSTTAERSETGDEIGATWNTNDAGGGAPLIFPQETRRQMAGFESSQKKLRAARMKELAQLAPGVDPMNEAQVATTAKKLGVTPDYVRANLAAWKEFGEANGWDAEKWAAENPEWTRAALNDPDAATPVLVFKERNILDKGMKALREVYAPFRRWMNTPETSKPADTEGKTQAEVDAEGRAREARKTPTERALEASDAAQQQKIEADQRRFEAETATMDQPTLVQQVDTPDARFIREEGGSRPSFGAIGRRALMTAWERAKASHEGLQASRLWMRYSAQRAAEELGTSLPGDDSSSLMERIKEREEAATPLFLGDNEGGVLGFAGDVGSNTVATAEGMALRFGGAGAGGLVGAGIGAGVGAGAAALAGQPELIPIAAAEGAEAGLGVGARIGMKAGGVAASVDMTMMEGGELAKMLYGQKDEHGNTLDSATIFGASLGAGMINMLLEGMGSEATAARLGNDFLAKRITRDPTLRDLFRRLAVERLKDTGTEMWTEPMQTIVREAIAYLGQIAQSGDVDAAKWNYSWGEAREEMWGALTGSIIPGGGSTLVELASANINNDANETANEALPAVMQLAAAGTSQARPEAFAAAVADATSASGHPPITHIYVDADEAQRLYQSGDIESKEAMTTAIGADIEEQLESAVASGDKLKVPMAAVPGFAASEVGKALADSITADPETPSRRLLKTRGEEIRAAAKLVSEENAADLEAGDELAASQRAAEEATAAALEGNIGKRSARSVAKFFTALKTAFMTAQAEKAGKSVTGLFRESPISFSEGTPLAAAETADDFEIAVAADEAAFDALESAPPSTETVDDTSFDTETMDEENAAAAAAAQEAATSAERQQLLADFGLNEPNRIAAAREYVETVKPSVSRAERNAKSVAARRQAQRASIAQQAARREAMLSILDVAEGKAETVKGSDAAVREARAVLRKRFGVVDNAGLDDIVRRATGVTIDKEFRRKKRTGPVDETRRQEFLKNVLGRVSNTRKLYQTDASPTPVAAPKSPALDALQARFDGLSEEERTRDFFVDPTTGALNLRAFSRLDPAGRKFAVIAVEGVKFENDNLGHDAGNAVYRAAATSMAPHVPELAKVGGDFAALVTDEAQLDDMLKRSATNPALKGYQLIGGVGATLEEAFGELRTKTDAARAAGTYSERGARPVNSTNAEGQPLVSAKVENAEISPELRKRLASDFGESKQAEQFAATYIEPTSGLFTKDGFDRLAPKRFIASFDFNGVKEYDSGIAAKEGKPARPGIGKRATDALIVRVANMIREAGGPEFDAAHVSGDEFLFQSEDAAALQAFFTKLRTVFAEAVVPLRTDAGRNVEVRGLFFGVGVGEDVDHAERELNADKRRLSKKGDRGEGLALDRVFDRPEGVQGDDGGAAQPVVARELSSGAPALDSTQRRDGAAAVAGETRGESEPAEAVTGDRLNQTDTGPKNLVVQHNLSASKLLHTERDLGGVLPVPSIAVARIEHPLDGFGEITLVGDVSMADPASVPVFDADAYTPRFPRTRQTLKDRPFASLRKLLKSADPEAPFYNQIDWSNAEEKGDIDSLGRKGRTAFALAWLKSIGKAPPVPREKIVDRLSGRGVSADQRVVDAFKGASYPDLSSADWPKVVAAVQSVLDDENLSAEDRVIAEDSLLGAPEDRSDFAGGAINENLAMSLLRDQNTLAQFKGKEPVDEWEWQNQILDEVKAQGEAKFEEWANAKLKAVLGKRVISIFDSNTATTRELPFTLKNVVKEMTRAIRGGEAGSSNTLGRARAQGATRFKTVDQMKAARERVVDENKFDAKAEELNLEAIKLADELDISVDHFGAILEATYNASGDSADTRFRPSSLLAELRRDNIKTTPAQRARFEKLARDLAGTVTEYFEAKPQRAVGLGEFSGAVVPHSASEEVVAVLSKHGLSVERYDPAVDGDRQKAIERVAAGKNLLFSTDEKGTKKGYTSAHPEAEAMAGTVEAFLNKNADASTVIHEGAHGFLGWMQYLSSTSEATKAQVEQWANVTKALVGRSLTSEEFNALSVDERTAAHEKFARSFEAYVLKGETPAAGLKRAFAAFSRWLVRIYKAVLGVSKSDADVNAAVPGAQLNEEMRAVFDAMLSTEAEVQRARRERGMDSKRQKGESAEAFADRQEQDAVDFTEGSYKAQRRSIADALRRNEKWWKAEEKALATQYGDRWNELPAVQALRFIETTDVVFDRAAVVEAVGERKIAGVRTTGNNGVRPQQVAGFFGYPDARSMLEAIDELRGGKERWVANQVEAEMQRMHPGVAARIEEFRAQLNGELHATIVRQLSRGLTQEQREGIRQVARESLSRLPIGDVSPRRYLQTQRRAARQQADAAAKGDVGEARRFQAQALLNAHLYDLAVKAQDEADSLRKLAGALKKTAAREKLGKASESYLGAVDYLTASMGFGQSTGTVDSSSLGDAVAQLQEDDVIQPGVNPDWLEVSSRAAARIEGDFKALTVAEVTAMKQALTVFRTGAARANEVTLAGEKLEREEAERQLVLEIESTLPDRGPVVPVGAQTARERVGNALSAIDGMLLTPTDMVRELIGTDTDPQKSLFFRLWSNGLREAQSVENQLLDSRIRPILEAFDAMPRAVRAALNDDFDGRGFFPDHTGDVVPPRKRFELLSLALNSGSESSRAVLLEGRNISEGQLFKALSQLSASEIEFVNKVHETLETLRDPAFDLEQELTGLRPEAVEALPLTLPNGRLTGGYYPLKAEPGVGRVGQRQAGADALAQLFDPTFTRPGTSHGHLKSRTGAAYVVTLDLDVMRKHLMQVAHDIAFRRPVMQLGRLIMADSVQKALQRRLGLAKAGQFLATLKDVGGGNGLQGSPADTLLSYAKRNLASSALSGFPVALSNFANLAAAVASTPLKSKHLAAGVAAVGLEPVDFVTGKSSAHDFALSKSKVMGSMESDLVRKLNETFSPKHPALKALQWTQDAGTAPMRFVDRIVSTAIWTGAYRQALSEKKTENEAVLFADDVLLQAQPAQIVFERSGVSRERSWFGQSAIFYGYLNVAYRAQHRLAAPLLTSEFAAASPAKKAAMAGSVAARMAGFYVAFAVLGELLNGRGPESGDEDDDDTSATGRRARWLKRKMLVAPLSTIPVVPLAQAVEASMLGKKWAPRGSPVDGLIGAGVKLSQAEDAAAAVKAGVNLGGLALGLPTRFVNTTGAYLWNVATGETVPENAGRFIGGVLYGERDDQPENVPQMIGDALSK